MIAVVAAESKEIAYKAADLIQVEYEPIEGIFDPREAIKPTSRLIHPEYKSRVANPHPLFQAFVKASLQHHKKSKK